jgi:outer membrane lipoprotein SlyB
MHGHGDHSAPANGSQREIRNRASRSNFSIALLQGRATMTRHLRHGLVALAFLVPFATGCVTNSRGENGALLGGLGGAGLGAIAGNQVGHAGAGAVIGGLAGAVTGGVIGNEIDDIEQRNRAEIAARMGRPLAAGGVSIQDVIDMTRSGVNENVIVDHVQRNGTLRPLGKEDLIQLSREGVSERVIRAMQEPPRYAQPAGYVAAGPAYVVPGPPPPVVVEYYDGPYWGPRRYHHHHPPGYSVGFTYHN